MCSSVPLISSCLVGLYHFPAVRGHRLFCGFVNSHRHPPLKIYILIARVNDFPNKIVTDKVAYRFSICVEKFHSFQELLVALLLDIISQSFNLPLYVILIPLAFGSLNHHALLFQASMVSCWSYHKPPTSMHSNRYINQRFPNSIKTVIPFPETIPVLSSARHPSSLTGPRSLTCPCFVTQCPALQPHHHSANSPY